jgi:mannose-6-phosphate isomerase class I
LLEVVIDGDYDIMIDNTSFVALTLIDGEIEADGKTYKKGETCFIPAGYGTLKLAGNAKIVKYSL